MELADRPVDEFGQCGPVAIERGALGTFDHADHVDAGGQTMLLQPECFTQQPLDAVAFHGIANASPDAQTDAGVVQPVAADEDDEVTIAGGDSHLEHAVKVASESQSVALGKRAILLTGHATPIPLIPLSLLWRSGR